MNSYLAVLSKISARTISRGVAALMLLSLGCSDSRQVVREVATASGDAKARIVVISPSGGATVGFEYAVEVLRARRAGGTRERWSAVFKAYRVEPLQVRWLTEDTLQVDVDAGEYTEYKWSIKLINQPPYVPKIRIIDVPQQ